MKTKKQTQRIEIKKESELVKTAEEHIEYTNHSFIERVTEYREKMRKCIESLKIPYHLL